MCSTAFRAAVLAILLLLPLPAGAGTAETSGLPVPRFVSLRADKANMRTGPGEQYPIKWVYERPGLPLEIIAEYYNWRRVRDWQGTEGWMHRSMLSGRRYIIVTGAERALRAEPNAAAAVVAKADPSVIARLRQCPAAVNWCEIEVKDVRGWLPRSDLWGVLPNEAVE